jgi:sensor histidine kinase YesM
VAISISKPWLRRTLLALAIWTAIGCIFALPTVFATGAQRFRFAILLSSLAQWWAWGLLAPAIVSVDLRLPFSRLQIVRRILAHLLLAPLFTVVYIYLFAATLAVLRQAPWSMLSLQLLINSLRGMFFWSCLVYCLIVGVFQAYLYYQRYFAGELRLERLQRSLSEARLNALRMQLDPHFLFNALNTISAQLEREPRQARQMIEHLGDLLRLSLENKDRQQVPLGEELAFLDRYLAIQKIRFGDRLRVTTEIEPDLKYALVPSLVLQPLVENAIRHGLSSRATGGTITISASRIANPGNDLLEIRVADDGIGLPNGWSMHAAGGNPGLGLSVTRERILGLYPEGGSRFVVQPRREGATRVEGAEAMITLPLRFATTKLPEQAHGAAAD